MSHRPEKVASLIQEVVSEIILKDLKDPIFNQIITITEVKIGNDLSKATIYFRTFGDVDVKEVEKALNKAKGYIKKLLGERIVIKFMPELEFKVDDREEKERRLNDLFSQISKSLKNFEDEK